jgi:predicted ATP-binding protein involved in virulence
MEDAEGVVLLDELEAHLHPTWKIEIVERLRRTFPRVTFLASTHDPLCLKGLQQGEIVLLEYEPQRRVIVNRNLPPVNDLRADQIFTSVLFGLRSTRGDDTTAAIDRYAELLGKRRRTAEEQIELDQLEKRLEQTISAAETPTARHLEHTLLSSALETNDKPNGSSTRRQTHRPSPEELELRRQLSELLGSEGAT